MKRLIDLREKYNKTPKELALYLNIHVNTYYQYESGKRKMPIETLMRLAHYYDVSIDYILNHDIRTRKQGKNHDEEIIKLKSALIQLDQIMRDLKDIIESLEK